MWILLTASFGQAVPWLLGRAVDALRDPQHHDQLGPFCLAVIGVSFVQGVFRYLMRRDVIGASRHIEYDLRNDLYAHLLLLSPSYYDRSRTGDLMTRASSDIEAVRSVVGPAVMYFSNTLIIVSSSLVLMLLIDVKLTLLALLPMVFLSVVMRVIGRRVHARTLEVQAQESRLAARVQETFAGMRVVQSYVQEERELADFEAESRRLLRLNMRLNTVWGLLFPAMALIVGAAAIVTLWIGGQQVVRGAITLGEFVAFNAYLTRLTWPMISIGWVTNLLERGAASMDRIGAVLHEAPAIVGALQPAVPHETRMRGEIQLQGVSFAYAGHAPVLHDLDLHVRAGETVALVGPTGSGKSTLLALIARLYDPQQGSVRIDGHDVRDLSLEWLRRQIAVVPQETFLFSDTLAANIGLGGTNGDEPEPAKLQAAAAVAQLHEAVGRFPAGFQTVLGERGITLSGGQKQRTAIARAVLRDPAILLLDDCLSSVDTYTEEEILKRLQEVMRQRTSVIVAHRISTVRNADRVVVLDQGRIREQGTHEELMRHDGYYADLVRRQALREELEQDELPAEREKRT